MTSNRGRRGSHLDSLDTLLDMVDYACEHNIAKDTSDSYDFALPPELPRAEFHEFLDIVGYEDVRPQRVLPPSPIMTTKVLDGSMVSAIRRRLGKETFCRVLTFRMSWGMALIQISSGRATGTKCRMYKKIGRANV